MDVKTYYSKRMFGADLILKLEQNKYSPSSIADWANYIYNKHVGRTEEGLDSIIQDIMAMDLGDEFELSEQQLNDLALALMAKNNSNLHKQQQVETYKTVSATETDF
jgi:hypothetical protein